VQTSSQVIEPEVTVSDIVGITWQWAQLTETEPASQSVVPDPQNYTLVFQPDGEVSIKADCNMVGGTYTLEGASLTIALGPSTLAYCGDDSLDQLYLAMLGNVGSFDVENGRLALNLKEGAGKMVFDNGGSAEAVAPDVVGTLWKWEAFKDQSGQNDVTVDNPDNYTGGTYTLEGASLTIALGPSIMVYCGDDSLEQQYLALLGDVVTFVMHEGNLVLNLRMDAGNMIFTQG
jgi:heat shock protein HslJ